MIWTAGIICGFAIAAPWQDDPEDAPPMFRPGLAAEYRSGTADSARSAKRIDPDVLFDWGAAGPDPRIDAKAFSAHWSGRLFLRSPDKIRLRVHQAGSTRLRIDGRTVIDGSSDRPGWLTSPTLELEAGDHAFELDYRKTGDLGRIGIYWESDSFALEPIGPSAFRLNDPIATETAWGAFERGRGLAKSLRCGSCHETPDADRPDPAPSLAQLSGRLNPRWLADWLRSPRHARADARMPEFGLDDRQIQAMAAYLLGARSKPSASGRSQGDAEAGAHVFRTKGCLACHSHSANSNGAAAGPGGALDRIAAKRPRGFFAEWLKTPGQINADHQMPVFELSNFELRDLAAHLDGLGRNEGGDAGPDSDPQLDPKAREEGRRLVREFSCASCHRPPASSAGPDVEPRQPKLKPRPFATPKPSEGCLGEPDASSRRPGYRLTEDQRRDLRAYYRELPPQARKLSSYERGRTLVKEQGCLNCHSRDGASGLGAIIAAANPGADPDQLKRLLGEAEPPTLTSVGDKLERSAILASLEGKAPPRRTWLAVRMPKFRLSETDRNAIADYLIGRDRIPDGSSPAPAIADAGGAGKSVIADGQILVSSRGFGCISCHSINKRAPRETAPGARGPELTEMDARIRKDWFLRWMRNPSRIDPGTEMPSIVIAARGVLGDDRDRQIQALWQALNAKGFTPPGDRVWAEQILSVKPGERAVILRDVMTEAPAGSPSCPRALSIGLENQSHLLIDLDDMTLRSWWLGDFALQRAVGKSWIWEPAGSASLLALGSASPLLALRDPQGTWLWPESRGQTRGLLRSYGYQDLGVWIEYDLFFPGDRALAVREIIEPVRESNAIGFARRIAVNHLPKDHQFALAIAGSPSDEVQNQVLTRSAQAGRFRVRLEQGEWRTIEQGSTPRRLGVPSGSEVRAIFTTSAIATANANANSSPNPSSSPSSSPSAIIAAPALGRPAKMERIPAPPGFEAMRLPLDSGVMPVALTFQDDGAPIVASLKGQIHRAIDSDRDGFEDRYDLVSDPIAAPFGIAVEGRDVLAAHKPEILRLRDLNGDGRTDRYDVVATGWGYSDDYHDWTVGLVRDLEGRYVVTLGSDYSQRNRKPETGKWRGAALRIDPKKPLGANIEVIGRGLRFAQGVAINSAGDIFCTDNQGDRNPFNEINHLAPGHRHGVPSKTDPKDSDDPWPLLPTAVQVPHPWTRSVNGIAFWKDGPFRDHGIGCEYDRRGLVRFSLRKVGALYQGTVYPFMDFPKPSDAASGFLGPIAVAVNAKNEAYVGSIRDSGWGGGNNVGELVRIRQSGPLPLGIREVVAAPDGFAVDFTAEFDPKIAADPQRWLIASYRRSWRGTYETPDQDHREETIRAIRTSDDRRSLRIDLGELRTGFVYEIRLKGWKDAQGRSPWPAEAYATVNRLTPQTGE